MSSLLRPQEALQGSSCTSTGLSPSPVFSKVLAIKEAILSPHHNELLVSLEVEKCSCYLVWIAIALKQINKSWNCRPLILVPSMGNATYYLLYDSWASNCVLGTSADGTWDSQKLLWREEREQEENSK